jgi:hypothetical protein
MQVESLIVTLPDPLESKLGDQSDSLLESVQEAASSAGYTLGRFYLPWLAPESSGGSVPDPESSTIRRIELAAEAPGVMLFSKEKGQTLLVVFLVGETARFGIHKTALTSALQQAASLRQTLDSLLRPRNGRAAEIKDTANEIRILGPSFSGSEDSLKFALLDWLGQPSNSSRTIRIISGSATGIDRTKFLNESPKISFQTTMIPVNLQFQALMDWLGVRRDDLAILAEGDTSFGKSVFRAVKSHQQVPSDSSEPYFFKFPIHISDLVRASKALATAPQDRNNPELDLKHQNLPLANESASGFGDVIPLFSSTETNAMEVTLSELLRTIQEEQISYAIVGATDVHDVDYLVRRMRDCCAATRIIVLNANLLQLHSEVNPDLLGTIVASTYPLDNENQIWTPPRNVKETQNVLQFASDEAEGVYNAALALLNQKDHMVEYDDPDDLKSTEPPLWITVVGRDQFWPIVVKKVDDSNDDMVQAPARSTKSDILEVFVPSPFELLSFCFSLGCIAVWLAMIGTLFSGGFSSWLKKRVPLALQVFFGEAVFVEYRRLRLVYLLTFSAVLLMYFSVVACLLAMPTVAQLLRGNFGLGNQWLSWIRFFSLNICMITALYFGSTVTLRLVWMLWHPQQGPEMPRLVWVMGAVVTAMILAIGCGLQFFNAIPAPEFLFLRSATLTDGVSPFVAFLYVGLAGLVIVGGKLRRLNLHESRNLNSHFLNFLTPSFTGIVQHEEKVRKLVRADFWRLPTLWPFAIVAGLLYFITNQGLLSQHSIDGKPFAWLFFVFGLIIYIGLACVLVRFATVWIALRTLLRRLYWHATRGSYVKLRQQLPKGDTTVVNMLSADPSTTALAVSLEQGSILARGLVASPPATGLQLPQVQPPQVQPPLAVADLRLTAKATELAGCIDEAERALVRSYGEDASNDYYSAVREHGDAQAKMSSVAKLIAWIFEPAWAPDDSAASQGHAEPNLVATKAGEIFVAARVADYLRQVLPQLSTLAFTATSVVILMLFATACYPFPEQDRLMWFNWAVVLITVGLSAFVFFSINRDRVMSMLAGTTPGKVTLNTTFVLQILTHGIVPLTALLGVAFPVSLGRLVSWIASLGATGGG